VADVFPCSFLRWLLRVSGERDLLFRTTQLIRRYNAKSHQAKCNQFSVEIRISKNAIEKELINVNEDRHCVTQLVKDHGGHLVNQPTNVFMSLTSRNFLTKKSWSTDSYR